MSFAYGIGYILGLILSLILILALPCFLCMFFLKVGGVLDCSWFVVFIPVIVWAVDFTIWQIIKRYVND